MSEISRKQELMNWILEYGLTLSDEERVLINSIDNPLLYNSICKILEKVTTEFLNQDEEYRKERQRANRKEALEAVGHTGLDCVCEFEAECDFASVDEFMYEMSKILLPRDYQILSLTSNGYSIKEIASMLHIEIRTIYRRWAQVKKEVRAYFDLEE